jgi:hypothetical protein
MSRSGRAVSRTVVGVTLAVSVVAVVIVVVVVHSVQIWLVAAVLGGAASVIAAAVARLVDRGLAKGRELVLGADEPIVVSTSFESNVLLRLAEQPGGGFSAMSAGEQQIKMLVEASVDRAVVLRGLRINVVSRRAPIQGELMVVLHAVPLRTFDVDLDLDEPKPVPRSGTPDFPYAVSPDEPEQFLIVVRTRRNHIVWRMELDWTFQGQLGSTRIEEPYFQVTPIPSDTAGDATFSAAT